MSTDQSIELGSNSKYEFVSSENTPFISWENLTVYASDYAQQIRNKFFGGSIVGQAILKNVSGQITGGFWGLMGPSGSGKTTLLNAFALRLDPVRMIKEGNIVIDGRKYTKCYLKQISGYVMQDDLLHAEYTIDETLHYTAILKMDLTPEERNRRIDETVKLLGISHRRNVVVGDSRRKGISGGERKRLCIAMELISKPKLLFLDEPTSGLDSSSAYSLVAALREISDRGEATIIASIHQPPSKVFSLIENIILMRMGTIAYSGPTKNAAPYFASLGFIPTCERMNPADFFLDVISRSAESDIHPQVYTSNVDSTLGSEKPLYMQPSAVSCTEMLLAIKKWFHQFFTLLGRCLIQHWRRFFVFWGNICLSIIVAFIATGSTWLLIGNDQSSIGKRPGILFFCVAHQGLVYSLQSAHVFPQDRAVMLRERHAGTYHVSAYFLGKVLSDMVMQIPGCLTFSLIMWHRTGIQNSNAKLSIFLWLNVLCCQAATAMATMISTIFISVQTTVIVLAVSWELNRLYGGWFVSPLLFRQGHYFSWKIFDALSYQKYTFVGLMLNELQDLKLICWSSQKKKNAQGVLYCPTTTGEQVIPIYGYQEYTIEQCCWALILLIIGFRLISYLALKFIKV